MNFLSHFYFDRESDNCYHILGTILPDLLKNADKTIVLHPEKLLHTDGNVNSIIGGWNKHLEVDRYFHSSEFFIRHSHLLKKKLLPAIEGSPVKPFFLGHIAVELILDNLLLTTGQITADGFYDHLDGCRQPVVDEFLNFAGLKSTTVFFKFYDEFKKSRYLYTYAQTHQLTYALKRICMRVWKDPFTSQNEEAINEVLAGYRELLQDNFMSVFEEIAHKLATGVTPGR
ncbi:MAG: ACP phosphodiesterase [Mucilaginibacter sp.]